MLETFVGTQDSPVHVRMVPATTADMELDDLFTKHPIELELNDPLVNMLFKKTSVILENIKNNANDGDFKIDYPRGTISKFYKEGGKRKAIRRKKTKRKVNKARKRRRKRSKHMRSR